MADLLDPRSVHKEHVHPGAAIYFKVALVLFALTALEVGAYEVGRRPSTIQPLIAPVVVPIILVLSAAKFALVAMFYMHLKQDAQIYRGLFIFPLVIAAVLIVGLIVLLRYWLM
jgi:caa(3)-type oxidase subunit IV